MRRVAATLLVALVFALAGCSSAFGTTQPVQPAENVTYDWNTSARTTYDLSRSGFTAVIAVNTSSIEVYRTDQLGTEEPIPLEGLRFRYPNGTVITANASALGARTANHRTNISLPGVAGKVAFRADRSPGKRFAVPVFVPGSHAVVLPRNARVGLPLLSRVVPGGYTTEVTREGLRVYWDDVERGTILVRYYLQRDIKLFGALGAVLAVVGIVGAVYYLRQIQVLKRRREAIGPDVDTGDDDIGDDGPPPGMG